MNSIPDNSDLVNLDVSDKSVTNSLFKPVAILPGFVDYSSTDSDDSDSDSDLTDIEDAVCTLKNVFATNYQESG